MEEKNFDKKIKGILTSPPEFKPSTSDIDDMRSRLRGAMTARRRRRFLLWFLPLFALPLALGSYFIFSKYNHLNNELLTLRKQIEQTVHIDSTIQRHITYQYDTIYNVIYAQQRPSHSNNIQSTNSFKEQIFSFQQKIPERFLRSEADEYVSWGLDFSGPSLLLPAPSPIFSKAFGPNRKTTTSFTDNPFNWQESLPYLSFTGLGQLKQSTLLQDFPIREEYLVEPGREKLNPLYNMVPIGFNGRIGGTPLIFPTDVFSGTNYSASLTGEIEFVKNRSIQFGVEFLKRDFETKDVTEFQRFPLINGSDPMDNLFEIKPQLSYLQFPLMFNQRLFKDKKLQPSFGVGMVAYKPVSQILRYEFIANLSEYTLRQTYYQGSYSFDNLRISIAADYLLSKRIALSSGVKYQYGFSQSTGEFIPLRYWAWDFNLSYKFNKRE